MSYYDQQQQAPVTAYPPPADYAGQAHVMQPLPSPPQVSYVQPAPPPAGYPGNFNVAMMNPPAPQVVSPQPQTQSRGDKAFWEGCCAALCCCCLLDMCC